MRTTTHHPATVQESVVARFPACIVSGGQTGADRAALDFAIEQSITHAGYCPRGRKAEDGRIPDGYNLEETESSEYPDRTKRNIELAEATAIFHPEGISSRGSALTLRHAKKVARPCVVLRNFPDVAADAAELRAFLGKLGPKVLNVAGSRESSAPGMHQHVLAVLGEVASSMERPENRAPYPVRAKRGLT